MTGSIAVLAGAEDELATALLERLSSVRARRMLLGAEPIAPPALLEDSPSVLIDALPATARPAYFTSFTQSLAAAGTRVLNAPLRSGQEDAFFLLSLAAGRGLRVPRLALLPQRTYRGDPASLRALAFPFPWDEAARHVGFPAVLRPADPGGLAEASTVGSLGDVLRDHSNAGERLLVLQQWPAAEQYVRALCFTGETPLLVGFDPLRSRSSAVAPSDAVAERVREVASKAARLFGLDAIALDFAVTTESVWLLDVADPLAELRSSVYGEEVFHRAVDALVSRISALSFGAARVAPSEVAPVFAEIPVDETAPEGVVPNESDALNAYETSVGLLQVPEGAALGEPPAPPGFQPPIEETTETDVEEVQAEALEAPPKVYGREGPDGARLYGDEVAPPKRGRALSSMALRFEPLDLIAHWARCGQTADFLANFLSHDLERQETGLIVLSTVLNELVENAVKFAKEKRRKVAVSVAHWGDVIAFETSNTVEPGRGEKLGSIIERICTEDVEALFLEQIERTAMSDQGASGLGLITMKKDYNARLGVRLGPTADGTHLEVTVRVLMDVDQVEQQ